MNCPHCTSPATKQQHKTTALVYREASELGTRSGVEILLLRCDRLAGSQEHRQEEGTSAPVRIDE